MSINRSKAFCAYWFENFASSPKALQAAALTCSEKIRTIKQKKQMEELRGINWYNRNDVT
jgi:hypothetical protein